MSHAAKDYVKYARSKLGLTQAELAAKLGLERRSVMRFERGDMVPVQTRLAIGQLLAKAETKKKPRHGERRDA